MRAAVAALVLVLCTSGTVGAEPPATRTSTAPIVVRFNEAFVRASEDDIAVESRKLERPIFAEWWFWSIVGVAAAGVVVSGVILSSGGTFVPDGELGNSSTSEWGRF